jgi:ABC-type amino acid transport substrate-binding protein
MEDGQLKGFDIDLMNALAQRMQMKIKWFDFPFDTLIPELLTGKIHLCVGGMSLTKERGEKVLFSHVYLKEGSIVALMKKDSPWASSHDWKTAKILVCMGYTSSDDYVTQQLKLEPVRLNNLIDCVLALRAAQGDVLVGPSNSIEHLIKSDRDQWSMYTLKSNQSEGCVCLISKKYPHLQEPLNKALTELETEGYMEALKKKWGLYD